MDRKQLKKLAKFYKKASKMKEPVIEVVGASGVWRISHLDETPSAVNDLSYWRVTEGYKDPKETELLPCPFCGCKLIKKKSAKEVWQHPMKRCHLSNFKVCENGLLTWNTRTENSNEQ